MSRSSSKRVRLRHNIVAHEAIGRLLPEQVASLISLRHLVGGSVSYYSAAAGLPVGPDDANGLSSWPKDFAKRFLNVVGDAGRSRIGSLLEVGLIVHSDCSGKLGPEACLSLLDVALAQERLKLPPGWIVCWRACDSSPLCQQMATRSCHKPKHVFSDMLHKLPAEHVAKLEKRNKNGQPLKLK